MTSVANKNVNMAVKGGDSLRSPLLGPSLGLAPSGPTQALFKSAPGVFVRAVQRSAPVVEPRSGILIPQGVQYAKKKPVLAYELFLKYGGEGGIRTPDTLPYTHFPGVLLQPLGHLTILYCCLTAWGATGRYYRELRENGQAVFTLCFSFGYALYIYPDVSRRGSDLAL